MLPAAQGMSTLLDCMLSGEGCVARGTSMLFLPMCLVEHAFVEVRAVVSATYMVQ